MLRPKRSKTESPTKKNKKQKNRNGGKKAHVKEVQPEFKEVEEEDGAVDYRKYKTALCKHFKETRTCQLGNLCSFAHSRAELRHVNDVSIYTVLIVLSSLYPKDSMTRDNRLARYIPTTEQRCAKI
jgi:hypothetical protein